MIPQPSFKEIQAVLFNSFEVKLSTLQVCICFGDGEGQMAPPFCWESESDEFRYNSRSQHSRISPTCSRHVYLRHQQCSAYHRERDSKWALGWWRKSHCFNTHLWCRIRYTDYSVCNLRLLPDQWMALKWEKNTSLSVDLYRHNVFLCDGLCGCQCPWY